MAKGIQMTTALDISNYVLSYCKDNGVNDCSNKKLQKLLYYIQAWSLAFNNTPVFDDQIEAWLHGPVIPQVYHKYKEYGFLSIDFLEDVYVEFLDKKLIDDILSKYAIYDADFLEMRTHIESPWREARQGDKIITHDMMRRYYKGVLDHGGVK